MILVALRESDPDIATLYITGPQVLLELIVHEMLRLVSVTSETVRFGVAGTPVQFNTYIISYMGYASHCIIMMYHIVIV